MSVEKSEDRKEGDNYMDVANYAQNILGENSNSLGYLQINELINKHHKEEKL